MTLQQKFLEYISTLLFKENVATSSLLPPRLAFFFSLIKLGQVISGGKD